MSKVLVAQKNLHVGKNDKDLGLSRVTNPHLTTVQDVVITLIFSTSLKSEGIGTSTSFGDTETTDGISGKTSKVLLLQFVGCIFTDDCVSQGVLQYK